MNRDLYGTIFSFLRNVKLAALLRTISILFSLRPPLEKKRYQSPAGPGRLHRWKIFLPQVMLSDNVCSETRIYSSHSLPADDILPMS